MGVPLPAFQIAGGIILFLFALTMVFGESKPEGETGMIKSVGGNGSFPVGHAVNRLTGRNDGCRPDKRKTRSTPCLIKYQRL